MAKVYAFLADGLEEVECLAVVDVLRRSGVEVTLVSVTGDRKVTGSHGIELGTDALFEDVNPDVADVLLWSVPTSRAEGLRPSARRQASWGVWGS